MPVTLPAKFSMGLIILSYTLSSFNYYEKAFSSYAHNIVVIASGQYIFECRINVLATSVRVWIVLSIMIFWWWDPTPQNVIVWLEYSIDDMKGC